MEIDIYLRIRITQANAERLRWLNHLRSAYEAGALGHGEYLLARCALDRWHGLETWRIDKLYSQTQGIR